MKERRSNYFIQREFQLRFIIKFCLLFIAGCLLFGTTILIFSTRTATTSFENSRLVIKSTADFVLPLLLIGTVSTGFIVGIFTILLVLFISHKIAGPLYRLEKTCQSIASGNFREAVVLRRQDQLKGLAFAFNEMVLSLNNNIQNVKQHAQMLNYLLEETQNPKKIDEERKKLISALEVFKLK